MTTPKSPRRPTSITTRGGDAGTTSLLYGQRVSKAHPQIEAVGTLDELNVAIGAAKLAAQTMGRYAAAASPPPGAEATHALLETIQQNLVALMGEVACAAEAHARYRESKFEKLTAEDLARLDAKIAALEQSGLLFDGWARPGANAPSLAYDEARVTARRAERHFVALTEQQAPTPHESGATAPRPLLLQYLNRLSDLLWLLAREAETPPAGTTPCALPADRTPA